MVKIRENARLRFTGKVQNDLMWSYRLNDFQRTANSVLTVCVISEGNQTSLRSFLPSAVSVPTQSAKALQRISRRRNSLGVYLVWRRTNRVNVAESGKPRSLAISVKFRRVSRIRSMATCSR